MWIVLCLTGSLLMVRLSRLLKVHFLTRSN